MRYPPAYHITWGTYGMRLPGTDQPYVNLEHNTYGTPLPKADPLRERWARDHMKGEPATLELDQRKEVEKALVDFCARYDWKIHAIAAQSDHVHIVVTAPREGEPLRDALKAAASRFLNPKYGKKTRWAENGSARYLWEPEYFTNAVNYVTEQRDF